MPVTSRRVSNIVSSGKDGWEVHFAAWQRRQAGEPVLMLSVGDHDFDTPQETVDACVAALRKGHHHYTQLPGLPALRAAMARVSSRSTGLPATASEVMATPGGQASLFAATQGALDHGDHAIIIGPHYATYPGMLRVAGAAFTIVDADAENGFEPRADAIRAAIRPDTRAILINTPNNPTGAIYSAGTIEGIAAICREHDLWLISDEVYWALGGPDRPHLSPRGLPGMAERTLVVNSMSKSHGMTGWRVGWLTGPADFIRTLTSLNLVTTFGLNDFVSRGAIAALENDYGMAEIARTYGNRRAVFLEAIRGINRLSVKGSRGGMYVMLDVTAVDASSESFAWKLLEKEAISVMPGLSFGSAAEGHVRISLCQPEEVLLDAASRLRRFVEAYPG